METLDIVIEDDRWIALDLENHAAQAVRATLVHLNIDPEISEVTLLACDDTRIAVLNGDFRAKPTPTNVLSWPAEERAAAQSGGIPQTPEAGLDGLLELGDIALSFETCQAEAEAAARPFADHVTHLVIHGTLHLLGYDHVDDADATLMERLEVEILGNLGLDDPYM